jgi:hypothetical protein
MLIVRKFIGILSYLRRLYQKYPKSYSLIELMVYTGIFIFNVWIVPFWFWGIYRLDLPFPEGLETLFYGLWHQTILVRVLSLALGICVFTWSFFVRGGSLKELGIRVDNIYRSGRECAIAALVSMVLIVLVSIHYFDQSYSQAVVSPLAGLLGYSPWKMIVWISQRITQQFLLQSVLLTRFCQIFDRKIVALISAAMLFSFAHLPNMKLVILSFVFGLMCCILFSRNKNIFTLGMMHSVIIGLLFSLLIPGLIDHLRIGPRKGNAEFIAEIDYHGSKIEAEPLEKKGVKVRVTNRSTATWDSGDEEHPVFISYHLLSAKGEMLKYDNVRTPLPLTMRKDDSAFVDVTVYAPSKTEEYYLEVDVVKEKVTWFKKKGSKPILIPLSVK